MSFDEYHKAVDDAIDKYADAVYNQSRAVAKDLLESAEDLVSGWKDHYPRKKDEISKIVRAKLASRFN